MTEKVKNEVTNEIRELTADEITAVSGGLRALSMVAAPDTFPGGGSDTTRGRSTTIIRFGGIIGGSAPH